MGFLYSEAFLALMGLLMLDVVAALALLGLARAQLRIGNWPAADRWFRLRLAAPLPVTRLVLDGLHGQRAWVVFERLRGMQACGRFEESSAFAAELAAAPSTPDWLRAIASAEEAAQLGRIGHWGPARSRLDALLDRIPQQIPGLRAGVQALRLPVLLANGDWEEAEHAVVELESVLLPESGGWPVHRLLLLLVRDEDREALRLVRPLLEADGEAAPLAESEPGQVAAARTAGQVLAARAAANIGWTDLRQELLKRASESREISPMTRPVLAALNALQALELGESGDFERCLLEVQESLAAIERAPGPTADAEGLVALAESRSGRHEAACSRAERLLESASSPLARWRGARLLGELAEAAGRPREALEAYKDALAAGIETRLRPSVEARIARLESA